MLTASRSSERGGPAPGAIVTWILFLLLASCRSGSAEEGTSTEGASASLDREIAALQNELREIESEEGDVARQVESLAAREAITRRLWMKAAAARDAVSRRVLEEERLAVELREAAEAARLRARSVLREVYKQSGMAGYASLLSVSGPSDLLRGLQHLDALARRQTEAVTSFEQRRVESERAAASLRSTREALEAAVIEARREEQNLSEDRAKRLSLLERLRRDGALHRDAVAELARAAEELAEAIRNLPPGAPQPRPSISFTRLRGALPWPASGSILVPFGQVHHPRFGTVTPHPGLDIRVDPGAPVRSVGAGRVVFSRRYGGYGRTVVVDHGERYLSVYARLAAASVSEGDELLPGQEVGFAAEADERGHSSVYFELRHQGKAVDPTVWLRKESGRHSGRDRSR